uniref:D-isomer specific 2-hydroxyacid dehydrogenase NAD-binding domain-containing protein n=1 Tax=Panagrolaimus superbus TaxID=310955 RepID=A0A914Y2G2_9BILA
MPSLHKRDEMIEKAKTSGFKLKESIDLGEETGFPFYYCFTSSPLFMWMVESPIISTLIKIGQAIKILPSGFHRFNDTFLAGTVAKIVKGGQMGILSGAEILKAMNTRKIGIIGYGHLGEFLSVELKNRQEFDVVKIWNRTPIENENVLPLEDITDETLKDLDLVIEVAHPQIVQDYAELILNHTNFFYWFTYCSCK